MSSLSLSECHMGASMLPCTGCVVGTVPSWTHLHEGTLHLGCEYVEMRYVLHFAWGGNGYVSLCIGVRLSCVAKR